MFLLTFFSYVPDALRYTTQTNIISMHDNIHIHICMEIVINT